ncbi:MAG: hypothetical protein AAB527_00910 [Patescibacteria group bacterium]
MAYKDTIRKKILLLLSAGVALGFSRSPAGYFRLLKAVERDWKNLNRQDIYRRIKEFYEDRLVGFTENKDGTMTVVLTDYGKQKVLRYELDDLEIKKPKKWDGKWRVVIFDVPEKFKMAREALRQKLKALGFIELQKSAFVFPYECEDEINFISEVFECGWYVKYLRVSYITNEAELLKKFELY